MAVVADIADLADERGEQVPPHVDLLRCVGAQSDTTRAGGRANERRPHTKDNKI